MKKQKLPYSARFKEIEEIAAYIEENIGDMDSMREKVERAALLITQCRDDLRAIQEATKLLLVNQDEDEQQPK